DHDTDDIDACEAAALRVQAWSAGGNAATGGAAGLMGGLGLTLDIPATLSLAARNVRATGAAYGFGEDTDDERAFRLMILELAAVRGLEARADSLDRVNRLARQLSNPLVRAAVGRGSDWLVETVVERVARQLGVSLLQRKAAQVVPVLGGIVAATVNASFQTDVSRAARYAYRQRWLMARRMLPNHEGVSTDAPTDAPTEPPLAEGDATP
ncbi:EcsC family protein, partial [Brevirhabdus pacifica]